MLHRARRRAVMRDRRLRAIAVWRRRPSGARSRSPGRGRSRSRAACRAGPGLDALGHDLRPRLSPSPTIGAEGRSSGARVQARNERSILRMSTGNRLQVAERRVAGAEVVDREAHAELLELLEARGARARRPPSARVSVISSTSGRGSIPDVLERVADVCDDAGCWSCLTRQVHADAESWPGVCAYSRAACAARLVAAPTRPRATISPVSSASGMNSAGGIEPARRVMPADERLDAATPPSRSARSAGRCSSNWRASIARCSSALQLEPLEHALVHLGLEDPIAALAFALAMYIAASALRSSSSASPRASGVD